MSQETWLGSTGRLPVGEDEAWASGPGWGGPRQPARRSCPKGLGTLALPGADCSQVNVRCHIPSPPLVTRAHTHVPTAFTLTHRKATEHTAMRSHTPHMHTHTYRHAHTHAHRATHSNAGTTFSVVFPPLAPGQGPQGRPWPLMGDEGLVRAAPAPEPLLQPCDAPCKAEPRRAHGAHSLCSGPCHPWPWSLLDPGAPPSFPSILFSDGLSSHLTKGRAVSPGQGQQLVRCGSSDHGGGAGGLQEPGLQVGGEPSPEALPGLTPDPWHHILSEGFQALKAASRGPHGGLGPVWTPGGSCCSSEPRLPSSVDWEHPWDCSKI